MQTCDHHDPINARYVCVCGLSNHHNTKTTNLPNTTSNWSTFSDLHAPPGVQASYSNLYTT